MVAGDWQPYIPAVTIGPPRIGDAVVGRPSVVHKLRGAADGDLVVVTAPAGYGKTTAAVLWDEADQRPFAWVRLDYLDDDPVHLLLHIATAVVELHGNDADVLRYLRGPGRAPLTQLVPAVIRLLEDSGRLVLVLDDTHELSAPDAIGALKALVAAAPSSTTVSLLGRYQLPMEMARLRLRLSVVAVNADELRFSSGEAVAALESLRGPTDRDTAAAVIEMCEGWPAGVALIAMALRDGASVESIAGQHDTVVDYLVEEVLERLDTDAVTFLVESAVLDRFDAEQLDAVLEREDSAQLLAALSKSGNPFLIALDHQRVWYRYHRLFGSALRNRLRVAAHARFRHVASRAADFAERTGDIDGALLHALNAGDRARAATLVGREAVCLGFDGRAGVLARRLALLDARTFAEHPDAAIARAWLGVTRGDAELIHRSLMQARRADNGQSLADGTPSVNVAAALIGSLIGVGGVHDVVRNADVVLAAGDSLVNPWWGAATVMKGAAEAMLGNVARARTLLESALPVTDGLPGFRAAALAHLALLDLDAGDVDGAIERSCAARTLADRHDLCDVVPMVVVYGVSSVMSARIGDGDRVREALSITERLLDGLGHLAARTALLGHGLLALAAVEIRDPDLLSKHLRAAERAGLREPDAAALLQRVNRVRAIAASGARPLTAAELRLLPHLATHLSLKQIAEELLLGRETVKSQATSIYRKFGVSSRAQAVAEATRVGLLPE